MDSLSAQPATRQPETGKRTSESRKPAEGMTNVIPFARPEARPTVLPPENIQPIDFPVTRRQRASRRRNLLRQPCDTVSHAVTIAGKLQRGEALRADQYFDEGAMLWKGVEAARLLAAELEVIAEEHGRADQ
ncbi:hypothetical protein JQ613_21285 [Bradyrhizobium japonicum]|nr:hypothetical protein [Bradyrhizobium japonicum]